jgi:hypothetical protein
MPQTGPQPADPGEIDRAARLLRAGRLVAFPTETVYGLVANALDAEAVTIHQMPQSAADYAAALYEVLHRANAGNYNWIALDLPPNTPEWEAIQDRLKRAATK